MGQINGNANTNPSDKIFQQETHKKKLMKNRVAIIFTLRLVQPR